MNMHRSITLQPVQEQHSKAIALRTVQQQGSATRATTSASEILELARRRWKLVSAVTAVVVCLAYGYLFTLTPMYTATTQLLFEERSENLIGQGALNPEQSNDTYVIDSQLALLQSSPLLQRVVMEQKLFVDPEFVAHVISGSYSSIADSRGRGGVVDRIQDWLERSQCRKTGIVRPAPSP